MFNSEEQLQIALEVIQRLQTEMAAQGITFEPGELPHLSEPPTPEPEVERPVQRLPSLAGLLKQIGPQPPYSALIGLCEDGLPFLFDLSDPNPGSILIAGDGQSGKTRLLQSILASAGALNEPEKVCFYMITPRLDEAPWMEENAHCLDVFAPHERASSALILDFAAVANQRRSGREAGPVMVLAIDDLAALCNQMDDKVTRYLQWLIEYGPQSGVWTVATLEAGQIRQVDRRLLPKFGTRLIGKIASPALANHLTGYPDPVAESLERGRQFCVLFGNEWIRFWIPGME
jgi:hypothetical protein